MCAVPAGGPHAIQHSVSAIGSQLICWRLSDDVCVVIRQCLLDVRCLNHRCLRNLPPVTQQPLFKALSNPSFTESGRLMMAADPDAIMRRHSDQAPLHSSLDLIKFASGPQVRHQLECLACHIDTIVARGESQVCMLYMQVCDCAACPNLHSTLHPTASHGV